MKTTHDDDADVEVFETGGHALFVEEATRFNSLLDDFLREEMLGFHRDARSGQYRER